MNKKVLYNTIMEKVAVKVREIINESDNGINERFMSDEEVIDLLDTSLIEKDDNGVLYVNLDDLSILPQEIINELTKEIISVCNIDGYKTDEYVSYIAYILEDIDENSPILLRSADYYDITVQAEAEFKIECTHYYPGSDGTYDNPPESDEVETSHEIDVYNIELSDCGNNSVDINKEDVVNSIKKDLEGSKIEYDMIEEFKMNYTPDDYFDDYDRYRDERYN